jgi:hypothetical protein
VDDDGRAFSGEGFGDRLADAPAAAGDERPFVFKLKMYTCVA